jgi:hypothetical protein
VGQRAEDDLQRRERKRMEVGPMAVGGGLQRPEDDDQLPLNEGPALDEERGRFLQRSAPSPHRRWLEGWLRLK